MFLLCVIKQAICNIEWKTSIISYNLRGKKLSQNKCVDNGILNFK